MSPLLEGDHPCWLVFDNIQDALGQQGLINLLALALQRLPNRCNLAMLSRSDPPPHLVRFLVERRLNLVAWPRFAFTCEELRAFLLRRIERTFEAFVLLETSGVRGTTRLRFLGAPAFP